MNAGESDKRQRKAVRTPNMGNTGTAPNKVYLMTMQVTLGVDVVNALERLSVVVASKPSQSTHLIAHAGDDFPFSCSFLLQDAAAETKYRMKLSKALANAKELNGTLLANKMFYLTAKSKVDYTLLKSAVSAHGGPLLQRSPTVRQPTGHADRHAIS